MYVCMYVCMSRKREVTRNRGSYDLNLDIQSPCTILISWVLGIWFEILLIAKVLFSSELIRPFFPLKCSFQFWFPWISIPNNFVWSETSILAPSTTMLLNLSSSNSLFVLFRWCYFILFLDFWCCTLSIFYWALKLLFL